MRWAGQHAIVTLPAHVGAANADQVSADLIAAIGAGAAGLIADLTATTAYDHAGIDAISRAYQQALVRGTPLRLVIVSPTVRRAIAASGLDRLIPVYPSVDAALRAASVAEPPPAARRPAAPGGDGDRPASAGRSSPRRGHSPGAPSSASSAITPTVLRQLVDALGDGIALTDADGTLVLVNRRLEEMFGYQQTELAGRGVEDLVPADLRTTHRGYRAGYARAMTARPMGAAGSRLIGLRKDGGTFPVEISLSPVPTATGPLTLVVVRDVAAARWQHDLGELARAAAAAERSHRSQELLDRVVHRLFNVGLSLQNAVDLPAEAARLRIEEAVSHLDDAIREIRDHVFAARSEHR